MIYGLSPDKIQIPAAHPNTATVLALMNTNKSGKFYLTGSRFFQPTISGESDYDFFVADSPETRAFIVNDLVSAKFVENITRSNGNYSYQNFHGPIIHIFRLHTHPHSIDIQLIPTDRMMDRRRIEMTMQAAYYGLGPRRPSKLWVRYMYRHLWTLIPPPARSPVSVNLRYR